MERKGFSKSEKSFAEDEMSTVALTEARSFLEALHDAEYRGRKDTDGAARHRLSKRLGLKENYLFRLQYRAAEMKDVAGEVYRRLKLAHDEMCAAMDAKAADLRAERLQLKADRHAMANQPGAAGVGSAPDMDSEE